MFKVVGYYSYWRSFDIENLNWNALTHIIYSFAIPDLEKKDGTLLPPESPDFLRRTVETAHRNNVKILLSLGGWSYNNKPLYPVFSEICRTKDGINSLVNSTSEMIDKYGFDGVDIDWERPEKNEYYNFNVLAETFYNSLKNKGKLLTVATPSHGQSTEFVSNQNIHLFDWINIMAYDCQKKGYPSSSFTYGKQCLDYWLNSRQTSRDKLVLGVPFFGKDIYDSKKDIVYRDLLSENPDALNFDSLGSIAYNGAPTLSRKLELTYEKAGGIMIWELNFDLPGSSRSLLNFMDKELCFIKLKKQIENKYEELKLKYSWLGKQLQNILRTKSGNGCYCIYEADRAGGGISIHTSEKTCACYTLGSIREKWDNLGSENSELGFPVTDEKDLYDSNGKYIGRYSNFQNGSIIYIEKTNETAVRKSPIINDKM